MPKQTLRDKLIDAFEECDREGRALHGEYAEAAINILRARAAARTRKRKKTGLTHKMAGRILERSIGGMEN